MFEIPYYRIQILLPMSDTPGTLRLFNSYYTSLRFSNCTTCSLLFRLLLRVVRDSDNTNSGYTAFAMSKFHLNRSVCTSSLLLFSVIHSPAPHPPVGGGLPAPHLAQVHHGPIRPVDYTNFNKGASLRLFILSAMIQCIIVEALTSYSANT